MVVEAFKRTLRRGIVPSVGIGNAAFTGVEQAERDLWAIAETKAGNPDAFGQPYEDHYSSVYRSLLYKSGGNPDVAEDLTQQTFMKALCSIHTFDPNKAPFPTWLHTIAKNLLTDYFRGSKSTSNIEDVSNLLPDPEDMQDIVEKRELHRALGNAISRLPDDQQIAIRLRLGGAKQQEIANKLGIPLGSVKSKQSRAIRTLGKTMNKAEKGNLNPD